MRSISVVTALLVLGVLGGLGTARAEDAVDYIKDAKAFYRVVACRGSDPLPTGMDQAVVDKHCEEQNKRYEAIDKRYLKPAAEFFAGLRPPKLPTTVVYAFGGGDLMSALLTYPDAREITTISLEHAGDPTRLANLTDKGKLAGALQAYRDASSGLLTLHDSTSENMRKLEKGGIPGQLSFHITGMALMGYEPVSLKFFRLETDGSLHYYNKTEIEALAKSIAKKVKYGWVDTDFSEAFNNMELTIRKAGDAKAPLIVHRHFAANLANKEFVATGLEKHLVAKGKIAALTKAASYLIHDDGFTKVRDYLLANMVWMPSDSTGIDPRAAKKAGFTHVTYGTFKGAFLKEANVDVSNAMVRLWGSQPYRKLPFRYGYPDNENNIHLMITQPAPPPEPKK